MQKRNVEEIPFHLLAFCLFDGLPDFQGIYLFV